VAQVDCATPGPPVPFLVTDLVKWRSPTGTVGNCPRGHGRVDAMRMMAKAVRTPDRDQLHRLLPACKCAFHVTLEQRRERLVVLPLRMLRRERLHPVVTT
jgi:hypothetical protein